MVKMLKRKVKELRDAMHINLFDLITRLLVFLYKRAEFISKEEGNRRALREFFHYYDHLHRLRMWKMQLLDDVHLLIKVR